MIDPEPLHFSVLKSIAQSAQHFLHALNYGRPDTAAMRCGRAAHSLSLGGAEVLTYPGVRRGAKWQAFLTEHPRAEILSKSEHAIAHGAAESLMRHAGAMDLIQGARLHEYPFSWRRGGFLCAGRADFVRPGAYIGDLKMCRSAHPEKFGRQAISMGYHAQLAWYGYGLEQIGMPAPEAYLIAVESTPPHPVVIRRLTPLALDYGNRLCTLWLEQLRGCLDSDRWPGYAESVLDLDCEPEFELQFPDDETEEVPSEVDDPARA